MKICLLFLFTFTFQLLALNSNAQDAVIEIKTNSITIGQLIAEIERQTDYLVVYSNREVDINRKVDFQQNSDKVSSYLNTAFSNTHIGYNFENDYIVLSKKVHRNASDITHLIGIHQQGRYITGRIIDENGEPVIGANVVEKGTTNGTITDVDGRFSLQVSNNAALYISYIGYISQDINTSGQTNFNITMYEDAIGLEEVVAIGYGTMKKSDLTGSIVSVTAKDIENRPITTLQQALQGKASGVLVRTSSAAPGSNTIVTIRGQNSINSSSSPLYIVDGLPLSNISQIPPEEIQSIEVLKDGSSTAIYGSRGANGVILISTKKGRLGEIQVSYNYRTSIEVIPRGPNLMNAEEFANIYTEWQQTLNPNITPNQLWFNGSTIDRPLPENAGIGTDWFDEVSKNGQMHNHRLNIKGGGENNTYSVSLHYLDHEGIVVGSNYKRIGANISNQIKILDWLDSGIDVFITNSRKSEIGENQVITAAGASSQSVIHGAAKMPPTTPIYGNDGQYVANSLPASVTMENPVASAKEVSDYNKSFDVFGKFYFEFNPVKDFRIRLSGGANRAESKNYFYNPSTTIYGKLKGGEASVGQNITTYLINENTLSYNTILADLHKIDIIAGFTYEQQIHEQFANSANAFFTDFYKYNKLQSAEVYGTPTSDKTQWQLASFINRINYIFNQKYLFTFTSRYDGSSRFGKDNKWGFFPSVAFAWRLTEEPFLKNFDKLTNLKIRTSWGITGNSNIGLYQSLPTFGLANYPFGPSVQSGVTATRLENKDLKWETTSTLNLGIDLTLINRINFVFDIYKKITNDLLYSIPLIETSGYNSATRNIGSLENKGFEFGFNTIIINNKRFKWNIGGMLNRNINEITKLTGDPSLEWRIGNALGTKRGYRVDGIINDQTELDNYIDDSGNPINNAKLGDWKIVDINGDGKIDGDDMKNEIIFNPNPDFTYGISNEFEYNNFGLSIFIHGMHGNQILNRNSAYFFTALNQIRSNLSRDVINNYWTPDNNYNVKYARLGSPTYSQIYEQNGFAEDGSFLKIQNIVFSYKIPLKRMVSSSRVYFSVENLYTFTKYSGFDPDISSTVGNDDFGIDQNSYPNPRNYTLGIELTF